VPHVHSDGLPPLAPQPSRSTLERAAKALLGELVESGEAVLEERPRLGGRRPVRILRRVAPVLVPVPTVETVRPVLWDDMGALTWEDAAVAQWQDLEHLDGDWVRVVGSIANRRDRAASLRTLVLTG
jgi:hypothetical protein